jgi:hypothetical protein
MLTGADPFNNLTWRKILPRLFGGALLLFPSVALCAGLSISRGNVRLADAARMSTSGSVSISNGSLTAGASQISVGGAWTVSNGAFVAGTSRVTFTGFSPSVLIGSTTFYSFTAITPGQEIDFQAGSTQTVMGVLALSGAANQLIRVRSTIPGVYAYLVNTGSNNVSFVNPKDNNAGGLVINAGPTSVDGGHTFNWSFGKAAPQNTGSISLSTTTITGVATDPDGLLVGVPTNVRPALTFSGPVNSATLTPSTVFLQAVRDAMDNGLASASPAFPGIDGAPSLASASSFSVVYDTPSLTATLVPSANLASGFTYQITVTTNVKSAGGLPLSQFSSFRFRTAMDLSVPNRIQLAASGGIFIAMLPAGAASCSDAAVVITPDPRSGLIEQATRKMAQDFAAGALVREAEYDYYCHGTLRSQVFNIPVTLTFPIPPAGNVGALSVRTLNTSAVTWDPVPGTLTSLAAGSLSVPVPHFSIYAVFSNAPGGGSGSVHAFPVPFKPSLGHTSITFIHLPSESTVRVYTINGVLVKEIQHSDASGSVGQEVWDVTSNGRPLGSDIYYYVIISSQGTQRGKLMVVR